MGWSVMIFAAGFGTRMKHLTKDRPKPMVEVAGQPLIDHALALTTALPAPTCVVNLHYKAEVLEDYLAGRSVKTIMELPEILDTGGGLRNALPLLGRDPVMTVNPDAIWHGPNPLALLASAWDPESMDGLLLCLEKSCAIGHSGAGNFVPDAAGRITRGDGLIYGGVQIIKTDRLHEIAAPVFSLNLYWDRLIASRRLFAMTYPGRWCDVGHPEGVTLAERLLAGEDVRDDV